MIFTKLYLPKVDEQVVHRSGLFEELKNGINKKVILVSATAGYGKTTLISDWINQHKLAAAWCSLDNRDNDPFLFLNLIIASVNKQEERIGQVQLDLLKKPGTVSAEYILELFINDLLSLEKEIILVLDDLHLIDNKQVFEILSTLIEYKPDPLKLVLSTRSDPPLSFARLRSQNEILEIRSDKLSFTRDDIAYLFNKKLKLGLKQNDFAILETKTEGWIAGLQLTALSVKGHGNISEYLEKMAGDNRYIMDYLMEEVLENQDDEVKEFFLNTSILEKLSGPLCDAILQKNNSQELLESLDSANTFLIPLDNERQWYRYHHLFADLLQQRLRLRGKEKVKELQERASDWFEQEGMEILAIEHALEAESFTRAMKLIDGMVENLWDVAQYATILKFGNYFTQETIVASKRFCLFYAWMLVFYGRLTEAEALLKKLEHAFTTKTKLTREEKSLFGTLYVVFNSLYTYAGNTDMALKYSSLAIKNIPEDDFKWKLWATVAHGESCLLKYDLEKANRLFTESWKLAAPSKNLYVVLISTAKLAWVLMEQGNNKECLRICQEVVDKVEAEQSSMKLSLEIATSINYSILGYVRFQMNDTERGKAYASKGYDLSKKAANISMNGFSSLLLSEILLRSGDVKGALEIMDGLDPKTKMSHFFGFRSFSLTIKLLLADSQLEKARNLLNKKFEDNAPSDKTGVFHVNISAARIYIEDSDPGKALGILNELAIETKQHGAKVFSLEIELLKVRAHKHLSEDTKAMDALLNALKLGQEQHNIQFFVSEGADLLSMLEEIRTLKSTSSKDRLNSISDSFLNELIDALEDDSRQKLVVDEDELSSRELDTLNLIARGLSNQEIAAKLFISNNTVKTHVRNILFKLEAKNRNDAVQIAKEKGIVT